MSKDYTSEELHDIAENLIEDLRDCEDGTKKSTHWLLKEAGYDIEEFDIYDLFEIHNALFEAAERNEITLDMSAYDDQVVGLPFNLYYIVKNEKAKIKCPYCGSKNIARILYGSLVYSKALKKKMDDGKIILGGCCITTVPFHDEVIQTDPARVCKHCKKKFGSPAVVISKKTNTAEDFRDIVTSIEFSIGGEYYGHTYITITKNNEGALIKRSGMSFIYDDDDRQITFENWYDILDKLYLKMYLHEWKKNYCAPDVLDGTQWHLEIKMTRNRARNYSGSNDYPAYWSELKGLFEGYTGKITP